MYTLADDKSTYCLKSPTVKKSSSKKIKKGNGCKLPFVFNPKILLVEDTSTIQYIHTEFLKK